MVWPHLKILWYGEDNFVGDIKKSKDRKTEEEMGRQINEWTERIWRFLEGSGRQGKMEAIIET